MRVAPSLLLPFAFLVVGCGTKAQQIGGIPRKGPSPRVVSLSPSTTEIIANEESSVPLLGRTEADDFPKQILAVPVVASVKPDFEKIKATGANELVYDADLYSPDDVKRIESLGIHAFAFKAHDVAGFEKELFELASELGSETTMNDYVSRIERERADASDAPNPKPKVAVVLGGGGYVAGTDSFVADVVRIGGGDPVGPKSGKFENASPESMVASAPDVIILATSKANGEKDFESLRRNPSFANAPAIKNGRVVPIDADIVTRRGARVDTLIHQVHVGITLKQGS